MTLTEANPLLTLAVVLVAGAAFGGLARRIHFPSVTGQILAGIVMGPSVLEVFDRGTLEGLHPVTHFALGLIAVMVGSHLNFHRLRNARKRLALLLLLEATLTPALVFVAARSASGGTWEMSILLAAMAVSTAPATILAVVKETRSKGVYVKTLIAAVALNNMACICLFEIAHTAARAAQGASGDQGLFEVLVAPFTQLLSSAVLGVGVAILLVIATKRVLSRERLATASIIAILLASGLADYIGVSSLLSCMFLGMGLANITPNKDETGHAVFADFQGAIFAIFFTLAGMELDFEYALPGGLVAILIVVARFVGKIGSARIAMSLAGATERVKRNLGYGLIPQAGVAVGLILVIQEDHTFSDEFRQLILAVGLTVVLLNEIVGPVLVRFGLSRSGDLGQDRARLIDFLHEENIVVDLRADTKEEAIQQLAEVLIRSNHLTADRDRLLESILAREKEVSTCVGGGLAVPHGVLEEGDGIVGAMGISREGLHFESPDGMPIHCMVVLATPPTQRDRHLEVLAALARAIGTDPNVQRQLFTAKTPAHAYEILHAEESEDFNYFLEGDDEP
ncbi:MAG: PTS fructose transporter subunit IIA [Planctomycetota bacterium]|nr:MAG: PTS fructose transporter subunit IIA [Planctomycetota bacterium]